MRTTPTFPSGFQCVDPNDIDRLKKTDELLPLGRSDIPIGQPGAPTGTKTGAWSTDCSYFAWPCGGGTVKLIPWDSKKNKLVTDDDTSDEEIDPSEFASVDDDDDDYDNVTIVFNKTEEEPPVQQRPTRTLDGKEAVWSIAFGTGSTKKDFSFVWKLFQVDAGLLVATGHQNGNIKVWDCNTGKLLLMLKDHKDIVKSLDFAHNGSLALVSGSRDGTVKFWDLNDEGNMYKSLRGNAKWVYDVKWSPKCDLVATVGSGKSVILWDILKDYKPFHLHGHYHDVAGCSFSPDGALLATASFDTRVIIWDTCTGQPLQEFGHMFPPPRPIFASGANDFYVRGISFHPHGHMIVTINDDGYVRCWDLENPDKPSHITEHHNSMFCTFSPTGHRISVGDKEGGVKFYQSPPEVASLQHICRMSIRKCIKTDKVDFLHMPFRLKEYLKYHQT